MPAARRRAGTIKERGHGGSEDPLATSTYLVLEDLDLPKEVLRQILEAADRHAQAAATTYDEPASPCAIEIQH